MTTPEQRQLHSATRFCEGLNTADVPLIATLLSDSPEFTHRYMPASLGPAARGTRNKAETLDLFKITFEKTVQLPPKMAIQGKDAIMFLVVDTGMKPGGIPYHVEYILIFTFEAGGDKILHIDEYQDSAYVNEAFKDWY
ncbi:hypothetical protein OE88DRAFT_1558220 [Heliocybe sulcata]|uniref:SnoaL-like domain-containing protein n=1 Tax=Heliocybe sulcata TaxID=5364 RepID=A0A5C3N396_9AGAM|nr:hypothetical protein OE88DRAFT_1558220 [Heliocybe sulcata]